MPHVGKVLIGILAMLAAVGPFASAPSRAAERRPNIVIIFADDMGFGDLSANKSGAWVDTPNLDALAASGLRFTDGYSAAPVCGPSRVGLLTGAYPQRYGAWWNPDTGKVAIPNERLLPAVMGKAGYSTAVVGKWNLPNDPSKVAAAVFDKMIWGGRYWPNPDGSYTGVGKGSGAEGGESGKWDQSRPGNLYLTDKLTENALGFIAAQRADTPFFLYLAYNAPHSPLEAAERFRDRVAHLDSEPKRLYAAMVLALDEGVGRVRKALAEKGFDKNTVVVFASDNGPAKSGFRGYKAEWPDQILGARGRLSGSKGTYREAGVREPFLVSWPGVVAPGRVSDTPVMTIDLFPTLARIAGATLPRDGIPLDGVDLTALLRGGAELAERDLLWAGRICKPKGCTDSGALRRGKWKLLIEGDAPAKLYDLASDPGEAKDRSTSEPDRMRALSQSYRQWKAQLPEQASASQKRGKPNNARVTAEAVAPLPSSSSVLVSQGKYNDIAI